MKTKKILAFASVLALVASGENSLASAEGGGEFDGVEVNIVTFTGPQIAEPLQRRAPDFNELTGAQVNVITVPFADLFQSILTDQVTIRIASMRSSSRRSGWSTTRPQVFWRTSPTV